MPVVLSTFTLPKDKDYNSSLSSSNVVARASKWSTYVAIELSTVVQYSTLHHFPTENVSVHYSTRVLFF